MRLTFEQLIVLLRIANGEEISGEQEIINVLIDKNLLEPEVNTLTKFGHAFAHSKIKGMNFEAECKRRGLGCAASMINGATLAIEEIEEVNRHQFTILPRLSETALRLQQKLTALQAQVKERLEHGSQLTL